MELTRRQTLAVGAGAAVALAFPLPALAEDNGHAEVIKAFTGGAEIREGIVEIDAPEIAENGNNVPVEVMAEGASSIILVSPGNPRPEIATFHFGKLAAAPAAKTRIRLAQTQELIAVAKLEDGSFAQASRTVKVTIGGCGG
ncbi:MAG: thiosulfate oxidation carrier protein SoxY [Pseudomonadota bacterium]